MVHSIDFPQPLQKPTQKPARSQFSSGPCVKPNGWSLAQLESALVGRSHRSTDGLKRLKEVVGLTREILEIPAEYQIALVPGSATGAIETLLWNLTGAAPLVAFCQDVFSARWATIIEQELKLPDACVRYAAPGELPNLKNLSPDQDLLLNWNGSTSGVKFPDADWIDSSRSGLVIVDVTSAAYTTSLPWAKFDAVGFSWQKGLGSEAAHGMVVLSPKAIERLNTYKPAWPIPYSFKLRHQGQFHATLFQEQTLNTPSLLATEDYRQNLKWAQAIGGLRKLIQRSQQNFATLEEWMHDKPWFQFLAKVPSTRSTSTICLTVYDQASQLVTWPFIERMADHLARENVALDIVNHPGGGVPSLRIWGGPTVETADLKALLPWLEWAYRMTLTEIST
jgi:Phosphoserine aminotransferase